MSTGLRGGVGGGALYFASKVFETGFFIRPSLFLNFFLGYFLSVDCSISDKKVS